MAASDQVGISGSGSGTQTASLGNYLRKLDESFIKTSERKMEGGIEMSDFEKKKYKNLKNKYGDEFSSIGSNTLVANAGPSTPIRGEYTLGPLNKNTGAGYPSNVRPKKGYGLKEVYGVDASGNKIYSDVNTNTLGAKEGSLIAMANTDNRGIVTAAPETKVTETKRMAGEGFFAPKNFQRSGVPDATIMTGEQMRQALTGDPGYKRFGTLDRPETQAAKDTAAFNKRYASDFFSPIKADSTSITERREQNVQSMKDAARERDAQFKATGQQTFGGKIGERRSGDDTYGTNVMSNPAFGFRSQMSAENQKKYDASAAEATRRSEVEPSKGNLIQSTVNIGKRLFNTAIGANQGTPFTKEVALQKRGEAEQVRYEKYLNRPKYQQEATARKEAGITNQMTIDKNREQVKADAAARNAEFQADKRAKAVEKAAKRTPENTGTGKDGTFGAGTVGQGMPSNPDFRGPGNNKAYSPTQTAPSTGIAAPKQTVASLPSDYKQTEAKAFAAAAAYQQAKNNPNVKAGVDSKGQVSITAAKQTPKSKAQAAALARKASGKSIGQTKAANKASMKQKASERNKAFQARKKAGKLSSSERTAKGQRAAKKAAARKRAQNAAKARRARKKKGKKKCDIFLKYNISPLTNMNLVRDDLAEVAYFVKEIQER